jgi:hypothetical protein
MTQTASRDTSIKSLAFMGPIRRARGPTRSSDPEL